MMSIVDMIGRKNTTRKETERLVKPTGSQQKYDFMVRKYVLGDSTLALALLLGLSTAVSSMRGYPLPTQIYHICGPEMVGGETAFRLALSTFGAPTEQGLIYSLEQGSGELIEACNQKQQRPIGVLDVKKIREFVCQQTELDGNDECVNHLYGKTFLSIGEECVPWEYQEKTKVIELCNVEWGNNVVDNCHIDEIICENYGHMGPRLVRYIHNNFTPEKLDRFCDQNCWEVRDFVDWNKHQEIACWSSILATADLAEMCFGMKFSTVDLLFLIGNLQNN